MTIVVMFCVRGSAYFKVLYLDMKSAIQTFSSLFNVEGKEGKETMQLLQMKELGQINVTIEIVFILKWF